MKEKKEKYYIHPPIIETSRGRIIAQNTYLRLEILHSVHYTRKSDDTNTRRYPPFSSSLPSSRFVFTYVVLHNAYRCNETSLHHYLLTEKHPFPLLSVEGSVGRSVAPRPNLLRLQPPFRPRQTRFAVDKRVNITRDRRNLELSAWQTIFLPLMRRESTDHLCNYSKWRERMWRRGEKRFGGWKDVGYRCENDGERFGILGYLLGVNIE